MATQTQSNYAVNPWEPFKGIIWSMYLVENCTIEQVLDKLKMGHDFYVT